MNELSKKRCEACEGIGVALTNEQIQNLKPQLNTDWHVSTDDKKLIRSFSFKDFEETMAFVNAVAAIAQSENHHPDLQVGYNYCHVHFMTHALNGLSLNDFICAAKVDKISLQNEY